MNEKWGGSCYGIAATIGLLYDGYIKLSDLTGSNASSYYSLPYPGNDPKFLNNINYYQLSQMLEKGGKKAAAVTAAYNNGIFSGLVNLANDADSVPEFLKKLVTYASDGHVSLLGFSTLSGGHAVLVTGCKYDTAGQQYIVQIYDENCIASAASKGTFCELRIPKDYSSFTYIDAKGTSKVTNKTFTSIYLLDWSKMNNVISSASITNNKDHVYIDFRLDMGLTVTDSTGKYLTFDGTKLSGNMTVYGLNTIDRDDSCRLVIETDSSSSVTVSDIDKSMDLEVYDSDDYLAVNAQNIEGATLSLDSGITMSGNDYSFEAYISTDEVVGENENGLVSVSAEVKDEVHISADGGKVSVVSDKPMEKAVTTTYVGTAAEDTRYENSTTDILVVENKADTLKFENVSVTKTFGDAAFINKLMKDTDGTIIYTSSNPTVATVDTSGKVTVIKAGTTEITASVTESDVTKKVSASYVLTVEKKAPILKFNSSSLTKEYGAKKFTNKLSKTTDGKVTYRSSNTKVAKVNASGNVTIRGVGTAKITASAKEGTNYTAKSVSYTIKVNPKGTSISSLKAEAKGFTVSIKKQTSNTNGYQIQYSTSSKFKNAKTIIINKNTAGTKTISKLEGKKLYYVRIRTYKIVSGKKYYSSWSKAKTVTTKK